ncbi:hypothetical protein SETIT_3G118000v2 [Setaria italica]|uniref:Uncharacterized protein n=1 Tax=Setaria italica TaxID=4555 RepID=A0A368QE16_SETIT|nr:hypothetical protein SETIT_3G118000v2 [Setaria italica]RCV16190.1 hypothetical protein SETIT_3G118000v2 [Setaria italica]
MLSQAEKKEVRSCLDKLYLHFVCFQINASFQVFICCQERKNFLTFTRPYLNGLVQCVGFIYCINYGMSIVVLPMMSCLAKWRVGHRESHREHCPNHEYFV